MERQELLQGILWLIAAYHLLMGLGALLSERAAERLALGVFGIKLELAPQTSYIVKLLGVYVAVFGLIAGMAAVDPAHYSRLLDVIVLLYALRILNKVGHRRLYTEAFGAKASRVWTDVAMLAFFGGAVLLLKG